VSAVSEGRALMARHKGLSRLTPEVKAAIIEWYLARAALGTLHDQARLYCVCDQSIDWVIAEARRAGKIPQAARIR
jgi:hypothetical protein